MRPQLRHRWRRGECHLASPEMNVLKCTAFLSGSPCSPVVVDLAAAALGLIIGVWCVVLAFEYWCVVSVVVYWAAIDMWRGWLSL